VLPAVAARWARPALVEFGPNDVGYTTGFRQDWERERLTRFRWTGPHATVTVPVRLRAEGVLRARVRRHLIEPAEVTFYAQDREIGRHTIGADTRVAYRTLEMKVPAAEPSRPLTFTIGSTSANPRPLGLAMDWMELDGRLGLTPSHLAWLALAATVAFAAPRAAGLSRPWAIAHAGALIAAAAAGTAWDIVASERILREGAPAYLLTALLVAAAVRWKRLGALLRIESAAVAGALVTIALVALAVRLVILLHPQFYYPDVKVHALFAWQLARHGLVRFLEDFTANQYRFSLGLQMENGHWYAFPYPPAFYALAWPLIRLARYRPEVAVSILAAVVNSIEAFVVFALARRLRAAPATALAAAAALIVLPIFITRLSLAYFPALVGHFADAIVILVMIAVLARFDRARPVALVAGLVGIALLTYTQSLLNFAVLVPLVVLAHLALDRTPGVSRRMAGLMIAAGVGGLIALAAFYGRYVPIFVGMQRGIPMAEERILLEKQAQAPPVEEEVAPDVDDPYSAPTFDALRGVRKAVSRMLIFYSWLAPVIVAGIVLVARRQDISPRAFVIAWALTYVALNFLSGSLPGPNLVRYNKDLEVVAPLFCVALAMAGEALWSRSRPLAVAFGVAYALFGAARAAKDLTTKFVLER
jgi:hypothetical protein